MREMLARGHFPHAVILAGPAGAGKYTLALMLAQAMNCLESPTSGGLPDFWASAQTARAFRSRKTWKRALPKQSRRAKACAKRTGKRHASSYKLIRTCW